MNPQSTSCSLPVEAYRYKWIIFHNSTISLNLQSANGTIAATHAIPTPNALNNNFFWPSILFFNSLTIVRGTDTDEVLPYF